jgi:acetate kinase
VDHEVVAAMEQFLPAAPVHNRIYLDAFGAFFEAMPNVPLIAAFETEFHSTMPPHARYYGVPDEWRTIHGIERYGFHGASHQFMAERTASFLGRDKSELKLVSCHLGGSSSVCAIHRGHSIDTTMGFSPQSGLENATRHGDLDVFAVLFMMDRCGWTSEETRQQLARESGLAGLSRIPGGDIRDIERNAVAGDPDAALALDVFSYQVRKAIGAYAAAMGGIDAVAFTGGIGENSAALRRASLAGLEFLGITLDSVRNETGIGDRFVSSEASRVSALALATNEELIVARRAYRLLV